MVVLLYKRDYQFITCAKISEKIAYLLPPDTHPWICESEGKMFGSSENLTYILNGLYVLIMSRTCFKVNPHSIVVCIVQSGPVWPNGWVYVYELSGFGFESSCSHLYWMNDSQITAWFVQCANACSKSTMHTFYSAWYGDFAWFCMFVCSSFCHIFIFSGFVNLLHAAGVFLCSTKTSAFLVFRRCRKSPMTWNGLRFVVLSSFIYRFLWKLKVYINVLIAAN